MGDHRETTVFSETKGRPQGDHSVLGDHRETTGRPQGDRRETTGRPQRHHSETKSIGFIMCIAFWKLDNGKQVVACIVYSVLETKIGISLGLYCNKS